MGGEKWINSEKELLEHLWYSASKEEILATFPDRTWTAICHMAKKICRPFERRVRMAKPLNPMNVMQLAYLAGLIDGEGSIFISLDGGITRPYLTLTMTSKELVETMRDWIGCGSVAYDKHYGKEKDAWKLSIDPILRLKELLERLKPYLILKKKQAELLIEFIDIRLKTHERYWTPRQKEIYDELKCCNFRGRRQN